MESIQFLTKNDQETRKAAEMLGREFLRAKRYGGALIIGLEGNLGGGKTTFTQGLAKGIGVKEKISSPTFVLLKIFKLPSGKNFKRLIHIDAYRLDSERELEALGWAELAKDFKNIVVIEWADKVRKLLPKGTIVIKFKHLKGDRREITISV